MVTNNTCYFLFCIQSGCEGGQRHVMTCVPMLYIPSVICVIQIFIPCKDLAFLTQNSVLRRPQPLSDCKQPHLSLWPPWKNKLKEFRLRESKCLFKHMYDIIKGRRQGNYPKHIRIKQTHFNKYKNSIQIEAFGGFLRDHT